MRLNKFLIKKVIFTLVIIYIYILGKNLILPFTNISNSNNFNTIYSLSDELRGVSVFALGLSPWMSSMIIWRAVTALNFFNSKEFSLKRSNLLQKYLMLVISILQSVVIIQGISFKTDIFFHRYFLNLFIFIVLIAGAFIMLWFSYLNSQYGIGGTVLIIIVTFVYSFSIDLINILFSNQNNNVLLSSSLLYLLLFFTLCALILGVLLELSEYRIAVIRIMLNNKFSNDSYIPIKLNSSGGMAFMYAMPLMMVPQLLISGISHYFPENDILIWLTHNISIYRPLGIIFYLVLLVLLSFAFTFINVDIEKISDSLKKSGDFIEGCSPGFATKSYLYYKLRFFATIGSIYVLVVAGIPLCFALLDPVYIKLFMFPGIVMMCTSMVLSSIKELDILLITNKYKKSLF